MLASKNKDSQTYLQTWLGRIGDVISRSRAGDNLAGGKQNHS